jgi:hypothetical protein
VIISCSGAHGLSLCLFSNKSVRTLKSLSFNTILENDRRVSPGEKSALTFDSARLAGTARRQTKQRIFTQSDAPGVREPNGGGEAAPFHE